MNKVLEQIKKFEGKKINQTPSPFANWLDGTLVEAQEDSITISYFIRPEMANPMQIAHGGILTAMMDEVIGTNVYALGNANFFASVNIHVDFLSAAPVNSTVYVTSKIMRRGSKMVNVHCEIRNAEGKLLAYSASNLTETHREKK